MLNFPSQVRIYVALFPADMRKQANGLSALVMQSMEQEPTSGHLFVFFNRNRDIIRILFWDIDGFCVFSKRLERGRFRKLQVTGDSSSVTVSSEELTEMLRGISLSSRKRPPKLH